MGAKFAKILLVSILALIFFTGCAEIQRGSSSTSASPVLDRIQKRGELIVGTMGDMPPLNMTSKDGEIFGLEPDLAELKVALYGQHHANECARQGNHRQAQDADLIEVR